jgi:uncharacterized protein (TIGR02118 family)
MHKLMILFRQPGDILEFEERWSREFVPLAEKMPGIRRVTVSRVVGGPGDESDIHLVHEFFFDDLKALRSAMASEEGQKAGHALMAISSEFSTLCFAEHLEEDRPAAPAASSKNTGKDGLA